MNTVEGTFNVAYRLLMHLIPYAHFENERFCPPEMTQRGIAACLQVGRPFVSKTLKILKEKGFVDHELKHPLESIRHEMAYFLTVTGMGLATALRRAVRVRAEALAGGEMQREAPRMRRPEGKGRGDLGQPPRGWFLMERVSPPSAPPRSHG